MQPTCALPILVGITGHRTIPKAYIPVLEGAFREYLADISARHPHSPIVVISALADGGDRLAARVALDAGCRLLVPLPMPQPLYEADFPESVEEFRQLLARADEVVELPLQPDGPRSLQYSALGAWICRHSHEVVALWDGDESCGSGTAEVVSFRMQSIPPHLGKTRSLLDSTETGPVWHIPTPRGDNDAGGSGVRLVPAGDDTSRLIDCWQGIERFNRDANERHPESADLQATASSLARRYGRAQRLINIGILLAGALAAFALQLYSMLDGEMPMADVYALFFLAIGLLYGWGKQRHFNERHIDYQALAEALRVQAFWHRAGIREALPEHFLARHADQFGWIYEALKSAALPPFPQASALPAALRDWIAELRAETARLAGSLGQRARQLQRSVYGFYGISFVLSVFLYVAPTPVPADALTNVLVAALGMTASCGTLLLIFNGSMNYAGRAAMQESMLRLLDNAAQIADRPLPAHEIHELAVDLGREILQRKGDWLLMQR